MGQPSGLAGTVQAAFYERSMSKSGVKMLFTALGERFTGHRQLVICLYTPHLPPLLTWAQRARASAPGEISHIPLAPPKTPDGEGVRNTYCILISSEINAEIMNYIFD